MRRKAAIVIIMLGIFGLMGGSVAFAQGNSAKNHQGGKGQGITSFLSGLVSNGAITQEQETAIENALKPTGSKDTQEHSFAQNFQSKFDALVTAGTITQDQESAVVTALQSRTGGNPKSKLDALVTAGTISQDQETDVESALRPSGVKNPQEHNFAQDLQSKLDALVSAGTITQAQETEILNGLKCPTS